MAVMLRTSLGEMVIDLHTDICPLTCKNFLKLCKIKYYNNCLFHSVQKDFIAQTGDPTGKGTGGDSIYKFLYGDQARFFQDEIRPNLKHDKIGVVAMASAGENLNASQFYITTREGLDYLDGKHTVFGEIAEGIDTLMRINEAYVDENHRPFKNIRVKETSILDDPFDDPEQLADLIPDKSPQLQQEEDDDVRLEDNWVPLDEQHDPEEVEKLIRQREAHSRAVVLEMIGDIPEAEMKPPENVLFICKLNPVTEDEDLNVIFSRFGTVVSADIIRDHKTGDSLCYGFVEFETQKSCEEAYFKMDNVLIDDRRVHVDFSQSVAKQWNQFRRFGNKVDAEDSNWGKDAKDKASFQLKDTGGQRGGTGKRYEMVFENDEHSNRTDAKKSDRTGEKSERTEEKSERTEKKSGADRTEDGGRDRTDGRLDRTEDRSSRDRTERRVDRIDRSSRDRTDRKYDRAEDRVDRSSRDRMDRIRGRDAYGRDSRSGYERKYGNDEEGEEERRRRRRRRD